MDLQTLYAVYAAVMLACAGSLVITWRQNPSEPGPRSWALGSVSGGAALFIFALTPGDGIQLWINGCGDLLAWLGVGLYARGTREYVKLTPTPPWMLVVLPLVGVAMFAMVGLTPNGRGATIIASSTVFSLLCLDLVTTLLRRPQTRRPPGYFLAFFFGLFGVTHAVRGAMTVLDIARPTFHRPIDHALMFVGIVGAAATAMGFAMLTTERVQRERARHLNELEQAVDDLRAQFEGLSAGDYSVRARGEGTNLPMDVLARLFNQTAERVGLAFDQLEKQRSVLAATLESMIDGLLLLDAGGRVVRANPAMQAMLGVEGKLAGRAFADLLDEADRDFAGELLGAVAAGPVRERLVRFRASTGSLALTVNASVHRDGGGQIQGAVLVVRDDRDLREAQAQLQMSGRLAAMGTIAAGVAHEINNPLSFVLSNLDFALEELGEADEEVDAEILEALKAARHGGDRVRKIVLDLKSLSRSDGESEGRVDVNDLVASAVAMLHNEIRHHAQLAIELGEVPEVRATEAKLGQVFLNLVQNAVQAIPPGHAHQNEIRIRSGTTPEGRVFVEVTDTGEGISPEHMPRIFDAFFTTKPVGVGTGLGLAISHRAVTNLGGTLAVESEPGVGSRFRVELPRA